MIKVSQLKSNKKKYDVSFLFDDFKVESFIISEDLVVSYRLIKGKILDEVTYKSFCKDQKMDDFYQKSLRFTLLKPRSKDEVRQYLSRLEDAGDYIEMIVNKLEKLSLLNDDEYVKNAFEIQFYHKLMGPLKLKSFFIEKKIPRILYEHRLSSISDKDLFFNLDKLYQKKINSLKNKPIRKAIQLMKQYLYQKGYNLDIVSEFVNQNQNDFHSLIDEDEILKTEIFKQRKKYRNQDLSPYDIEQKIIKSVLTKGYGYYDIKRILERG